MGSLQNLHNPILTLLVRFGRSRSSSPRLLSVEARSSKPERRPVRPELDKSPFPGAIHQELDTLAESTSPARPAETLGFPSLGLLRLRLRGEAEETSRTGRTGSTPFRAAPNPIPWCKIRGMASPKPDSGGVQFWTRRHPRQPARPRGGDDIAARPKDASTG